MAYTGTNLKPKEQSDLQYNVKFSYTLNDAGAPPTAGQFVSLVNSLIGQTNRTGKIIVVVQQFTNYVPAPTNATSFQVLNIFVSDYDINGVSFLDKLSKAFPSTEYQMMFNGYSFPLKTTGTATNFLNGFPAPTFGASFLNVPINGFTCMYQGAFNDPASLPNNPAFTSMVNKLIQDAAQRAEYQATVKLEGLLVPTVGAAPPQAGIDAIESVPLNVPTDVTFETYFNTVGTTAFFRRIVTENDGLQVTYAGTGNEYIALENTRNNFTDLADVDIPAPVNNKTIHWDGAVSKWVQVNEIGVVESTRNVEIVTTGNVLVDSVGGQTLSSDATVSIDGKTGATLESTAGNVLVSSSVGTVVIDSVASTTTVRGAGDVDVRSSTGRIFLEAPTSFITVQASGQVREQGFNLQHVATGGNIDVECQSDAGLVNLISKNAGINLSIDPTKIGVIRLIPATSSLSIATIDTANKSASQYATDISNVPSAIPNKFYVDSLVPVSAQMAWRNAFSLSPSVITAVETWYDYTEPGYVETLSHPNYTFDEGRITYNGPNNALHKVTITVALYGNVQDDKLWVAFGDRLPAPAWADLFGQRVFNYSRNTISFAENTSTISFFVNLVNGEQYTCFLGRDSGTTATQINVELFQGMLEFVRAAFA